MKGYTKKLQLDVYLDDKFQEFMTVVEHFQGKKQFTNVIARNDGFGADAVSYQFKNITMLISFPVRRVEQKGLFRCDAHDFITDSKTEFDAHIYSIPHTKSGMQLCKWCKKPIPFKGIKETQKTIGCKKCKRRIKLL